MGKKSQRKGKSGEYEFARLVGGIKVSRPRKRGIDVVGIRRMWFVVRTWEVKRIKSGVKRVYDWVKQARDEGADAVVFRADGEEWLIVMPLDIGIHEHEGELE